nr:unnamed protein product [Callosobruchus chinensis]
MKKTTVRKLPPSLVVHAATTPEKQARLQTYALNRTVSQGGSRLSSLLQGGIKTLPPKPSSSGIKVLENVRLNSSTTAKMLQNRTIDVSKISMINPSPVKGGASGTNIGNVLLLPDGKLKTVSGGTNATPPVKGTPIILPISPQRGSSKGTASTAAVGPPGAKFITAKRQLVGPKPRPIKKPYLPASGTVPQQILPPPTNLTTQDIMDLPIIFADDNQIIEPSSIREDLGTPGASASSVPAPVASVSTVSPVSMTISKPSPTTQTKVLSSVTPAKYMVLNKPSNQSNFIFTSSGLKKQMTPVTFGKPPPKYTKIILSSKKVNPEEKLASTKVQCFSPDIPVKKLHQQSRESPRYIKMDEKSSIVELIDLENEIKATAVPKPNFSPGLEKQCTAQIIHKKLEIVAPLKRQSTSILDHTDETDPDYVPPKNLKLN